MGYSRKISAILALKNFGAGEDAPGVKSRVVGLRGRGVFYYLTNLVGYRFLRMLCVAGASNRGGPTPLAIWGAGKAMSGFHIGEAADRSYSTV
jgi:hypothetical protein